MKSNHILQRSRVALSRPGWRRIIAYSCLILVACTPCCTEAGVVSMIKAKKLAKVALIGAAIAPRLVIPLNLPGHHHDLHHDHHHHDLHHDHHHHVVVPHWHHVHHAAHVHDWSAWPILSTWDWSAFHSHDHHFHDEFHHAAHHHVHEKILHHPEAIEIHETHADLW